MRGGPHSRKTVLLVEDEGLIRQLLAFAFEDAGFDVLDAGSADEAVQMLETAQEVAAIITDVRMPGRLDGLGLVRWLATARPSLPIVITSGYVPTEQATSENPAVFAVVSKPYVPEEIVRLVRGRLSISG
jgi:CheY-like chemotaxis protein